MAPRILFFFEVQTETAKTVQRQLHILHNISKFRHFVTSFLLTCQPHKIKFILDFTSLFTLLEKCSLEKESFMIEKIRQIDRGILEEISYRYMSFTSGNPAL